MTTTAVRPTATPIPAGGRDPGIDLVRALCIIGVVVLHSLMVGVQVASDGAPVFTNAAQDADWIVPVSWILQVMPLFFVIGGFAGRTALQRRKDGGAFAAGRVHRLLLPATLVVAVVGAALVALTIAGVPGELTTMAGYRFGQPLWFLAVFLLCQFLLPLLSRAHDRQPLLTVGALIAVAVAVDLIRAMTGMEAVGLLNLAFVWLSLQQLGFFLADGRIDALTKRTRIIIGAGAATALAATMILGIHSPDLISHLNPPTTALILVGVAHTMLLSLLRPRLTRWSRHAVPARVTSFMNARAMTVYLWHMPVLLGMAGITALTAGMLGLALPAPGSISWWITRPVWVAVALVLTALTAWALAAVERRPAPEPTRSPSALVRSLLFGLTGVVLLLVAGVTPLTALIAVIAMGAALRAARRSPSEVDVMVQSAPRVEARTA